MKSTWLIAFAMLTLAGCGPAPLHFCETTLHSDGRIDRAIIQPLDSTPEEVRAASVWEQSGYLEKRPQDDFDGEIRDSKLQQTLPKDGHQQYFASWQRFASVDSVPEHLEFGSETRTTKLKRTYRRRDFGLVVEHLWIEELPNTIKFSDAKLARRALAQLFCDRAEAMLEKGIGDEFDNSKFVKWLRGEGTDWFEQVCATHLEAALIQQRNRSKQDDSSRFRALLNVFREHGLDIKPDASKEQTERAVLTFFSKLIEQTIQRRNGQPLSAEENQKLSEDLLQSLTGNFDENALTTSARLQKLKVASDDFAEKFSGGTDGLRDHIVDLSERIWGIDGGFLGIHLGPRKEFAFKTTLPGKLIETNGELISENSTSWRFDSLELFPLGVTMRARSLERVEFAAPGLNPLLKKDNARLSKLISLVDDDEPLMKVLQRCREAKSLKPLDDHIAILASEVQPAHERASRVQHWLTHNVKIEPAPAQK